MLCDLERTEEHNKNYSNPDNDLNGPWRTGDVRNALYRRNLIFDLKTPSGKTIKPPPNGWRWSKETIQHKIATGEIVFSADETRIIRKIYLKNVQGRTPETILFGKDVGTTRDAAAELKELFAGVLPFETPKPVPLIKHMCTLAGVLSGDIVLDFFAGSGATSHAIIDLNKQDAGARKFVLVQLPEPTGREDYATIAEITKERVRRVLKKINEEDESKLALDGGQRHDRGFRVFKLAESNFHPWNANIGQGDLLELEKQLELHVDHVRDERTDDDLLYEILLKSGYPLTTTVEKVVLDEKVFYSVAAGLLLVCLEKALTHDIAKAMAERKPERVVCLDESFAGNDQLKANAVQIFKTGGLRVSKPCER